MLQRQRQLDNKAAAAGFFAFDFDRPLMLLDDQLRYRQT